MTYPVGALPNVGQTSDFMTRQNFAKAIPLTDSTSYDFTDPANGISPCAVAIYVGVTGNVVVKLAGNPNTAVTYTAVPAGTLLRGLFTELVSATATKLVAFQ